MSTSKRMDRGSHVTEYYSAVKRKSHCYTYGTLLEVHRQAVRFSVTEQTRSPLWGERTLWVRRTRTADLWSAEGVAFGRLSGAGGGRKN